MRKIYHQKGYSLLALMFALAVLSILITMTASTQKATLQRDLEADFLQRGRAAAEAISRYNNLGRVQELNPGGLFPKTLDELVKGVSINGKIYHFLRSSALYDPISGKEWKVIRAGDPSIKEYLQNWAAYYGQRIPQNYQVFTNRTNFDDDDDDNGDGGEEGSDGDDGEEEEEEEEDENPPSDGGSLGGSQSLLPIIGVMGSIDRPAFQQMLGRDKNYSEWIFIYIPTPQPIFPTSPN